MNLKRQIESLRDTANRLSLDGAHAWHCESGVRGALIVERPASTPRDPSERFDFARPMMEHATKAFMRRLLCGDSETYVVEEPWRAAGFPFVLAEPTHRLRSASAVRLEGIGHSFIYGDGETIAQLAQLVAVPAVRLLSACTAGRSYARRRRLDPEEALGEWVYMIYDVGAKVKDDGLQRYCRFLVPLPRHAQFDDTLAGFDGNALITRADLGHPRLWEVFWSAAGRRELALSRLGLSLVVASRIALDHLLDMKLRYVPTTAKPRGAPRRHDPARDQQLMENWDRVRGKGGLSRQEFCDEKGITLADFVKTQDRHRKQSMAAKLTA